MINPAYDSRTRPPAGPPIRLALIAEWQIYTMEHWHQPIAATVPCWLDEIKKPMAFRTWLFRQAIQRGVVGLTDLATITPRDGV
jgi:hypothetical protein